MISARGFAVLRHAAGIANHVNKIVNVNYASNYCKIDESVFGLSNEQREVNRRDLPCAVITYMYMLRHFITRCEQSDENLYSFVYHKYMCLQK